MQLTTSSGPISLRAMISRMSSSVASRMAGDSLTSTVVAPRRAKRRIGAPSCQSCAARPSLLLACLAGCGGGDKLDSPPPSAPRQLTVTSPDFPANGAIPARFSCDGDKARPALRFAGVPAGAAELALVVVDPDAGGFVHWTAYALRARHARARRHAGCPPARARARTRPAPRAGRRRARRAAPTATSSACTGSSARAASTPAPSRTTSSPRCAERGRQRPARGPLRARAEARARASLRRRSTSAAVSRRWRPAARSPRRSGPKATRRRSTTRWPTASHIRRTWRLRPSWIVSSSSCGPSRRTWAGAVRPSSSSTPSRSARRARSLGRPLDSRPIGPRHLEARVGERVGEVAVVGEQDQAGAVGVQATDRVQALPGGHEVDDRGPAVRVGRRGDHAGRLVQRVDDARARPADQLAVDGDRLLAGDVARRVGDHGAVDGHPPVDDERLRRAPRGDARVGEVLSEAHGARDASTLGHAASRSTSSPRTTPTAASTGGSARISAAIRWALGAVRRDRR